MEKENRIGDTPLVSIIMPAFNAEQYIERAILSVLGQTMKNWELLVIDDCSRDGTVQIVQHLSKKDPRIILLKNEENVGVSRTRNRGIELSKGEYIAFLDSDDVWHGDKLEKQLLRMETAKADIGYCSYALIDEHDIKVHEDYIVPGQTDYESLLQENVIGCSTVIVKAAVAKAHPFRADFYHEDYVLWLHLLKKGFVAAGCPEVLVSWRHLNQSRSANKIKSAKKRWMIYRKCERLPLLKSIRLFCGYTTAGFKKYKKRDDLILPKG